MNTRLPAFAASLALSAAFILASPAGAQTGTQPQPTTMQPGMGAGMGPGMGMGRGMGMGMGMGMGGGYGMGRGGCHGGMGGMMGGMGRGYGMMQYTDGSLAFLKAELKITGNQEKAWNKFAKEMRDSANLMRAAMQSHMTEGPPKTLAERFDRQEAMMTARLQSLRSTKAALVPLYDLLDAGQKQKLDGMMMRCRSGWSAPDADDDSGQ